MKKYTDGGKTGAQLKKQGMAMKAKGTAMKAAGSAQKAKGAAMKSDALSKKAALRTTYTPGVRVGNQSMNSDGSITKSMKKGGSTKKYQSGGASGSTGVDNMTTNTTAGQRLNYPTGVDNMTTNTTAGQKLNYKTGGMVNSNAKVSALKSAGSKGVKSKVNPKATASKVAKGRVGGTSAAPKKATPGRK